MLFYSSPGELPLALRSGDIISNRERPETSSLVAVYHPLIEGSLVADTGPLAHGFRCLPDSLKRALDIVIGARKSGAFSITGNVRVKFPRMRPQLPVR